MRYIGIIILLVLCLALLLFADCITNTVTPEIVSGNLENQEDINQSSNNSQDSSIGLVYETVIADTEDPEMIYPQTWATGTGTVDDPWANDCLNDALTACPAGGTIYMREGYYLLETQLYAGKTYNLIGEGIQKTFIIMDISDIEGIAIWESGNDYCTLKGFTIDGDSQTLGINYPVMSVDLVNYVKLEDIEIINGGGIGINMSSSSHCLLQNIFSHDNYSHGIHPGTAGAEGTNIYNTYNNINCWDNGENGFDDWSAVVSGNNTYNNMNCWDNGEYGIAISNQTGSVLSNSSVSGNADYGLYFADMEDFSINNCFVTLSGKRGIYINGGGENVNFTNVISKNNNCSEVDEGGIGILNSNDITLTSCQFYDDSETPLQSYGIELYGTNTGISLLNCKLSPNVIAEIWNQAGDGVGITVITEKMLAKF